MLKVENICQHFGSVQVLNDISFELQKGQVLGFIGRNGAGKTTFLRTLLGIYDLPSGSITWNGEDFRKSGITTGYLPEERGLFLKEGIVDQLIYFGQLSGMSKKEVTVAIDEWLERFNIMEYKKKKAGELSKGNQQKVQLIGALLHNPEFIVLDEPFSGLDPVNAEQLHHIFLDLKKEGRTVVFSSHRMENVETFCDKIFLIQRGKEALSGSISEIKKSFGYRYARVRLTSEDILPGFSKTDNGQLSKIATLSEYQQLLSALSTRNDVDEISIAYPSMQEIFIETVGEQA
ncbi:MAG: ABC transporter ATP-binding protein [Bacilli bacterium]